MPDVDTPWFNDALAAKRMSQRGLAKLLGCNASSVNRLVNGKRPLRFEEAETLAMLLGVTVSEVISRTGIGIDQPGDKTTRLVGFIDGAAEAHIDWNACEDLVTTLPGLPKSTVAVQYRTALSAWECLDGWTLYVEPPEGDKTGSAVNHLSLVTLDSGMTLVGFLRRGYREGTFNVSNFGAANLENVHIRWATPVLLLRP